MRITGKVSKNAPILLTAKDNVPIEKLACPIQFCITPCPLIRGPDLNKPPFDGLHPM